MNYNVQYANQLKENSNFFFENYHLLPANVLVVLSLVDYDACGNYIECERILAMLNEVGWTAEYDLAGELFDLKQLETVKGE